MDLQHESIGLGRKPALVVIDMMRGFTDPACELGVESDAVVAANQRLLVAFRQQKLPVFFTTVIYANESQAQLFRQRIPSLNLLQPDSKWVEIDSRLTPLEGESVINKHWASGFHKTDLDQQLRAIEVDSIVVTGLTTSGCVRATAVDGTQYDYRVVVASDAVGDRNREAHLANLFDLKAKYADVTDSAEIIRRLGTGLP